MKKIFAEFKEFINRGNVVDMAVGIMIGAAFKAIVDSLVNDIISPLIGLLVKTDFSNLSVKLFGVELMYGAFIMALLNFFIIAVVLFLMIKVMNNLHNLPLINKKNDEPAEEEAPTTKLCPFCQSEIAIAATRCPHCTSQLED
ncbi:MAG: large conductance mechanosensitive channel protein MscL [Clostridia bacterium]|nr:large conductance mechanosensitive channel protein MscL [Clostridia bacterium]